jgi:hypothetical protein
MAYEAIISSPDDAEIQYTQEHEDHLSLQEHMHHHIAFNTEMMGDIIFFHQVLQQPDAVKFVKALIVELHGNIENKRWKMIQCSQVPRDINVIPLYGPCNASITTLPTR